MIPKAVQHAHEHDPDRLAEVEQAAYLDVAEHLPRFTQIRPERDDVGAGHQRRGLGRHQRINVHMPQRDVKAIMSGCPSSAASVPGPTVRVVHV